MKIFIIILKSIINNQQIPSLNPRGTRERSSHQYSMKLYVCMLHLFLFASLCECCAFVLPSSASFLSSSPFRSRSSLVVGPRGPTRCVVTIVYLCTCQFTMYTTETAFGTLTTCCCLYFFQFDKSLSADCIGCLVHSLPLSVMVITPFPHPPSTDCHPGIIVNSKFCHGRL